MVRFFYGFTRWLQVSTMLKNGCSIGPSPQLTSHQNPEGMILPKRHSSKGIITSHSKEPHQPTTIMERHKSFEPC